MNMRVNRGGRPLTIEDDELWQRRDDFISLLCNAWGDVGWRLASARTRDELRAAVHTITDATPREHELLQPFLHETAIEASAVARRATRKTLRAVIPEEETRVATVRDRRDRLRDAKHAVKATSAEPGPIIRAEHETRRQAVTDASRELTEIQAERSVLEAQRADQEAARAQDELLAFVRVHKYVFNPRNFAFAMAGLPDLGWWESFRRCGKSQSQLWPSSRYRIFEVFTECWQGRSDTSKATLLNALRIATLATDVRDRSWIPVRADLSENWRYVRLAVEETDLDGALPEPVPYRLLNAYVAQRSKPRSPEEIVLAERDRLNR
jgi:hypothetical protein